jgi:TonB-linked SusC/RagA family outer membrane protein
MKRLKLLLVCLLSVVTCTLFAQGVAVRGTVTDASTGEPVAFASVQVKGTMTGAVTDLEGKYSITVPSGISDITLVFSFVGYKTIEAAVNGRAVVDVSIYPDTEVLEDVLVVAYGTAKKSSYSGSASMVRSESILQNPNSSFEKAMQGKVAGLQVTTSSGQPGATASFRIRGSGSLNASNEPLYVVDGIATSTAEYSVLADRNTSTSSILSTLNPQDIESVTVLKDAAAASLYGSRAANGVVIITTKNGSQGSGRLNLNAQLGVSMVPKYFELMNSAEYYQTVFTSYFNARQKAGYSASDAAIWANQQTQGLITFNPYSVDNPYDASGKLVSGARIIVDTDWQKEVLKPGLTQDYNVSYSGGNEKVLYFFSGGYFDQKGTSPTARYTRYSGKVNIDANVKPWLKAGMNAMYSFSIQNTEVAGGAGASPLYNSLYFPSGVPIYMTDRNGNYILNKAGEKQFNWLNPVSKDFNPLAIPYMDTHKTKNYRLLASLYTEIKFMEGLTLKTVFSPDYINLYEILFWNKLHGNGPAYGGRSERHQTHDLMYTSTTTLNFNRTFGDVHNVQAMAGYEFWHSTREYALAQGTNFAFDFMTELAAATSALAPSSWTSEETLKSYIARAEYSYDNKYFISGSFRRDGSSVFGADNKWGNFFSVGGSWRIDQESFIEEAEWISSLKLRSSYGTSGNNLGLGRYQSLGIWAAGASYNYGPYPGFGHTQFANPNLGWEKQAMFNVGIDFGFFDNRLYGTVEFFNKTSKDLLYNFPLPSSHGITSIMMNLAKVRNHGVELELGADIIKTGDWLWSANFNISSSRDKILDLAGNDDVVMSTTKKIWKVGYSQYEFYMPTWMGVDPANGSPLWKKDNGTTSEFALADYEMQGRATPWAYGGLTTALKWKNFSLSMMFYYNLGGKVYDGLYAGLMHDGADAGKNLHKDALDAWLPGNTNTNVPIYINSNPNTANSESTRFLYDATYFKFKNLNISYTLPKKWMIRTGIISDVKIYANIENIFTCFKDDWKGYDDIDIYGIGGYTQYAETMPLSRTFTFGVNVAF